MKKIKGTHDLIFEELDEWVIVENKIKYFFDKYNIREIRTPILEYSEVFNRSSQYSDMVLKEMFHFLDKKGRDISLRPEGTSSVVRSYVENKLYNKNNLNKFYYYGPFFRYERPQKGRYRQFHQFGVEFIGVSNYLSELELFFLINDIFNIFNLYNTQIKINTLGDIESRNAFLKDFVPYIDNHKHHLCETCLNKVKTNILKIFDCKICSSKKFLNEAPSIFDYLTIESKNKFQKILDFFKQSKINFEVDLKLVRGLDYYTDIVFEISYFSSVHKRDFILGGGGSYNELIEEFGGSKQNSIGFAIGMERLMFALKENGFLDKHKPNSLDLYVFVLDEKIISDALFLTRSIRQNEIKTDMNYTIFNFNKQFIKILEHKPKFILFLGEKELENNTFTIKKVSDKKTYMIEKKELINFLKKELHFK
ncbi:histidine--tRNA ligase ['Camptotheca acuminata' phytoplasma]|uniref:histidine--tRNA ligase n=1 Tax='Camptotheca acuminata' phytoplasma TaxID=3239192 RepID=UPI00351A2BFA